MDTDQRISDLRQQRLDLRRELARLDTPLDPTDTAEIKRREAQRARLVAALRSSDGEWASLHVRRARDEERAAGLAELALLGERSRMMFAKGKFR